MVPIQLDFDNRRRRPADWNDNVLTEGPKQKPDAVVTSQRTKDVI